MNNPTDKHIAFSTNNDFTTDSNIRSAILIEYNKLGFKLVPLSSDNKPAILWSPIYEDPSFWTAEKLVSESSKFKNVATVFGKTHTKNSNGQDQYLNGLDVDSEFTYNLLITPVEHISDPLLRTKIESLFSKTNISSKSSLLDYLKQVTCVVKTRKQYGLHVYWLSCKQHNCVRTQECKQGYEFEIKTNNGSGHATLPPSTHRSDESFRYSHMGRPDKIEQIDELYNLLLELFKGCLRVPTNGNGKDKNGRKTDSNSSSSPGDIREQQKQRLVSLYDLSHEAVETSIAYLMPYYIKGHRNDFSLSLSGAAWHSKISEESATEIVEGICNKTNDEETNSRLQTLHATYQKALNGEGVTGGPSLADLVSKTKGLDLKKAHKVVDVLKSIWHNDIKLQKGQQDTSIPRELSVSQAIREKHGRISVKGQLIGQSSVYNTVSSVDIDCDNCGYHNRIDYSERPIFQSPLRSLRKCPNCYAFDIALKLAYEYISTVDIEIQDPDKFNEIERLPAKLFEKNTENINVGEIVIITGSLHVVRKNDNANSKAVTVLYAEGIEYLNRKEKSKLTEQDIEEIKSWKSSIEREREKGVIPELVKRFAPTIIGNDHVKEGLLMVGVNTGIPNDETRIPKRMRLNALLIGDPSLAKSTMLRETVKVIPGARYESAQSSTGLSLTAQVSKEEGGTYTLRLGPIPLAKGSLCAINEIGQMPVSDHKHFLDFMEEGRTTINKFAFNATIAGNTSIIASANPINNTWKDKEKIDNSELPTLTQLIHRFDLIFVFREVTDAAALRRYAIDREQIAKNCKLGAYDGYEESVKKYLMYARTLDPTLSEDAQAMLREYWVRMGEAGVLGLPRKLETLERIALARAKLKLKDVADTEEATETMQFYNVILQHYQQTVTISNKPSDIAYLEVVEVIKEQNGYHISYVEAATKACNRNQQVKYYLGDKKLDLESNWKLRPILDLLRKNPSIGVNDGKPIVLWWKENNGNNSNVVGNNKSLLPLNIEKASSSERLHSHNVVEDRSKSEVSEVSEVQKGVSTQENTQEYDKSITEENNILAVKSQIDHNTENEQQQREEGNSSIIRTPLERKSTEDALQVTSETSDTSDSTGIRILHSPVSCKSGTTLAIAEGEAIEKSSSGHLKIRHSKSASVLTSDDIDSSDEEESRS